jgi:hypothetical protein
MADNYQLFSEIIPKLTIEERVWSERVLRWLQPEECSEDVAKDLKDAGIDVDAVDPDDWPGFQWELTRPDFDLWLYGVECGNVSHVGEFVRAFLARFRLSDSWSLTWAETCSKPRIGEFGGGALFVTVRSVEFFSAAAWIDQQRQAFEAR